MMDKRDLARLKKLAERATPGEWITGAHRHDPAWVVLPPTDDSWGFCIAQCQIRVNGFNNAAFIAAANPKTVLELIAELESLRPRKWACDECGEVEAELKAEIERLQKENAELRANNYGPEILNDPQALTTCYFAGRMAEGSEKNREMDKLLEEKKRLEKEADWLAEQILCCSDDNRIDTCNYVECASWCRGATIESWRMAACSCGERK